MTCWPACTAPTACWPRCMERERTGRGQVVRTSLLAAIVGVHAFQGTAWTVAGKVGHAQGNHHPSIAPYGLFHCARRQRAGGLRQRVAVAAAVRGVRLRPRGAGHGHQRRAGRAPRAGDRAARGGVRGDRRGGPAGPAGRGRHPGGQGAHHRRGLRLGPGALPGAAGRRRARHAGPAAAARPAAAVLRRRAGRRDRDDAARALRSPRAGRGRRRDPRLAATGRVRSRRDDVEEAAP